MYYQLNFSRCYPRVFVPSRNFDEEVAEAAVANPEGFEPRVCESYFGNEYIPGKSFAPSLMTPVGATIGSLVTPFLLNQLASGISPETYLASILGGGALGAVPGIVSTYAQTKDDKRESEYHRKMLEAVITALKMEGKKSR